MVFRGLLFTVLVIAWALSVVSVAYCSFIEVKTTSYYGGTDHQLLGLFKFEGITSNSYYTNSTGSGNYCVRYDDDGFEAVFNTAARSARAFGVLAALVSGFVLFMDFAFGLFWEWGVATLWKTCAAFLLVAFLFQSLTFLLLLSKPCQLDETDCTVSTTGYLSAISAVFFLASAGMMGCIIRPPAKPHFPISDMQDRHSVKLRYVFESVATFCFDGIC